MTLGQDALWLSPLAIAALLLSCFARGWRIQCLCLASVYFVGWLAVVVVDCAGYHPKTIIQGAQANKTLQATADGPLRSDGVGFMMFPLRSAVASAAVPELFR